jgi:hypothetical protein
LKIEVAEIAVEVQETEEDQVAEAAVVPQVAEESLEVVPLWSSPGSYKFIFGRCAGFDCAYFISHMHDSP